MTQQGEDKTIDGAVELLKHNGLDGLADAVTVLLNAAMVSERSDYLGVAPYERGPSRVSHANGFKDKQLKSRLGTLALRVPQTRDGEFYPQSLERGLRSARALLLSIAEMYVQGVSTRRVKKIVEELCGLEFSSTQVSRAAAQLDKMLEAWRTRELGCYRYIILDAQYEKVRQGGRPIAEAEAHGTTGGAVERTRDHHGNDQEPDVGHALVGGAHPEKRRTPRERPLRHRAAVLHPRDDQRAET